MRVGKGIPHHFAMVHDEARGDEIGTVRVLNRVVERHCKNEEVIYIDFTGSEKGAERRAGDFKTALKKPKFEAHMSTLPESVEAGSFLYIFAGVKTDTARAQEVLDWLQGQIEQAGPSRPVFCAMNGLPDIDHQVLSSEAVWEKALGAGITIGAYSPDRNKVRVFANTPLFDIRTIGSLMPAS